MRKKKREVNNMREKRKNKLSILALASVCSLLFLVMSIGSIASESPFAEQLEGVEPATIVYAHTQMPGSSWSLGADVFKEAAERLSNGQLTVEMYGEGQLGDQRQNIEQIIATGEIDMTVTLEPLSYWFDKINLYQLLYLFRDVDHLIAFEEGPLGQEFKGQLLEETGLRVLTYYQRSPRELTSNFAINSIEDIKDLKIRVTESKSAIEGWKAMGASPMPMSYSELFTSLKQGVVDAQENPVYGIYSGKFYEVQDYLAFTDHVIASVYVIISDKKYQSLPEVYQQIVDQAALEAQEVEKAFTDKETLKAMDAMEEYGIVYTYPDKEPFIEAAKEAWKFFPELIEWAEKVQKIQ